MTTSNVPQHIQENYEKLVADGDLTWEQVEDRAIKQGAPALAAFAREKASGNEAGIGDDTAQSEQTDPRAEYEKLTPTKLKAEIAKREKAGRKIEVAADAVKEKLVDALVADDAGGPGTTDYSTLDDAALSAELDSRGLQLPAEASQEARVAALEADDAAKAAGQ